MTTMKNEKGGNCDAGVGGPRQSRKDKRVSSRCIAIVLSRRSGSDIDNTDLENFNGAHVNGEEIFDDFVLRNKTCYWNPALVESIRCLKYKGFMHPNTLLVGGENNHLENLRTAWGRRVINAPANFNIETIGDVSPIEMEVIPQTNFVPLPEALCRIIMDLNNGQVTATLDVIRDRLIHYYGTETHQPMDEVIYETLGKLIRERKAYHTGTGYFVVTPDTYRLRSDDLSRSFSTHVLYHPMYVPPSHSRIPMKSISCQANIASVRNIPPPPPTSDFAAVRVARSNSTRGSQTRGGTAKSAASDGGSTQASKQPSVPKRVDEPKVTEPKSSKSRKPKSELKLMK